MFAFEWHLLSNWQINAVVKMQIDILLKQCQAWPPPPPKQKTIITRWKSFRKNDNDLITPTRVLRGANAHQVVSCFKSRLNTANLSPFDFVQMSFAAAVHLESPRRASQRPGREKLHRGRRPTSAPRRKTRRPLFRVCELHRQCMNI